MLLVRLGPLDWSKAAAIEQLGHDPDAENIANIIHQIVRRNDREILPLRSSLKAFRNGALERTSDDSLNIVRLNANLPSDTAILVKMLNRNDLFVASNLKNAIRTRVQNGRTCANMFFTQLVDNRRTARCLIANHLSTNSRLKLGDQIQRKSVRISRKGLLGDNPHHLPMPRNGVLPIDLGSSRPY